MAGLPGYGGAVYYGAQTSSSFTEEAMTDAGDDTTFTITDATKSMWDDTASFTVEVDDGGGYDPVASGFTINYAIGRVVFDEALGATDTVRVSGKYFTKTEVARAKEWSLDIEKALEDDTEFGSSWESSIPILGKASGSVKVNWAAGWFAQLSSTTPRIVLSLQVSTANAISYEFQALLAKQGVSASVKGLVEEELAFQSVGPVNYMDR